MPNLSAAIAAMDKACRVWSVGYDQGQRWNVYNGGETDCSALVIWALRQGGFDTGGATYTGNLSYNLTRRGWLRLPANLGVLQPGDILLNDTHHVCMVISGHGHSAIIAQASIDERGRASGGRAGDQTGYETNERRVYSYRHGWDCILRYKGAGITTATAQQASKPSGGIVVDGYWGAATTLALQKHFGTTADGIVSSQEVANRDILKACTGGWQWTNHPDGSQLITAIQKRLGVSADGIMGKQTVNALERHYGFGADGYLGAPSNTVKKMQQAINAGKF